MQPIIETEDRSDWESRTFNIKKETKGKTLEAIWEMIMEECGINSNPTTEWNNLLYQLNKISISEQNKRNKYLSINEDDQEDDFELEEVIPTASILLRDRKSEQRLTWEEKYLFGRCTT